MIATSDRQTRIDQSHDSARSLLFPRIRALLAEGWQSVTRRESLELRMGARSVTGPVRQRNEDRFDADAEHGICLVADGVGGHIGGAEASEIVARILPNWLAATTRCAWQDVEIIESAVTEAVEAARQEMIEFAEVDPRFYKMGATMAFAVIADHSLYVTRVGDCRAYLMHRDRLHRLTRDQSFVEAAVDAGVMTSETAANHPLRHVVTNIVGVKPLDESIMVEEFDLSAGDRVLLCSDGLTDVLGDDELAQVLSVGLTPQETACVLVEMALSHGAQDNVSCVVTDVQNCEKVNEYCLDRPQVSVA